MLILMGPGYSSGDESKSKLPEVELTAVRVRAVPVADVDTAIVVPTIEWM